MTDDTRISDGNFPVAIGGLGGSGTRVIAEIVRQLGFSIGDDLNNSLDNLWYTFLFKRKDIFRTGHSEFEHLVRIFVSAMSGQSRHSLADIELLRSLARVQRDEFDPAWSQDRAQILEDAIQGGVRVKRWGWKEPNTHILIDRLSDGIPGLRYIHLIRDGRDMAFSSNKRQMQYWADTVFGMFGADGDCAADSLHYWRLANERIEVLNRQKALPILEIGFEALCTAPVEHVRAIAKFCACDISDHRMSEIASACIRPPPTINRYQLEDLSQVNADDLRYAVKNQKRLRREALPGFD